MNRFSHPAFTGWNVGDILYVKTIEGHVSFTWKNTDLLGWLTWIKNFGRNHEHTS
jgi:hypothetical protein